MKKIIFVLAIACIAAACGSDKKSETPTTTEPQQKVVYQPKHVTETVCLKTAKRYDYRKAPTSAPAKSVVVKYDAKAPYYTSPIEIVYTYDNGDTFTYIIREFLVWPNQRGKTRILTDDNCTVWIQGQTKDRKFHEFVFYGDPKCDGKKIKPNSYRNLPHGEIKYRK